MEKDRTVCFCHCVSEKQICEAIANGAKTLESIQSETGASTGCGGCEFEVRELLERELGCEKKSESA